MLIVFQTFIFLRLLNAIFLIVSEFLGMDKETDLLGNLIDSDISDADEFVGFQSNTEGSPMESHTKHRPLQKMALLSSIVKKEPVDVQCVESLPSSVMITDANNVKTEVVECHIGAVSIIKTEDGVTLKKEHGIEDALPAQLTATIDIKEEIEDPNTYRPIYKCNISDMGVCNTKEQDIMIVPQVRNKRTIKPKLSSDEFISNADSLIERMVSKTQNGKSSSYLIQCATALDKENKMDVKLDLSKVAHLNNPIESFLPCGQSSVKTSPKIEVSQNHLLNLFDKATCELAVSACEKPLREINQNCNDGDQGDCSIGDVCSVESDTKNQGYEGDNNVIKDIDLKVGSDINIVSSENKARDECTGNMMDVDNMNENVMSENISASCRIEDSAEVGGTDRVVTSLPDSCNLRFSNAVSLSSSSIDTSLKNIDPGLNYTSMKRKKYISEMLQSWDEVHNDEPPRKKRKGYIPVRKRVSIKYKATSLCHMMNPSSYVRIIQKNTDNISEKENINHKEGTEGLVKKRQYIRRKKRKYTRRPPTSSISLNSDSNGDGDLDTSEGSEVHPTLPAEKNYDDYVNSSTSSHFSEMTESKKDKSSLRHVRVSRETNTSDTDALNTSNHRLEEVNGVRLSRKLEDSNTEILNSNKHISEECQSAEKEDNSTAHNSVACYIGKLSKNKVTTISKPTIPDYSSEVDSFASNSNSTTSDAGNNNPPCNLQNNSSQLSDSDSTIHSLKDFYNRNIWREQTRINETCGTDYNSKIQDSIERNSFNISNEGPHDFEMLVIREEIERVKSEMQKYRDRFLKHKRQEALIRKMKQDVELKLRKMANVDSSGSAIANGDCISNANLSSEFCTSSNAISSNVAATVANCRNTSINVEPRAAPGSNHSEIVETRTDYTGLCAGGKAITSSKYNSVENIYSTLDQREAISTLPSNSSTDNVDINASVSFPNHVEVDRSNDLLSTTGEAKEEGSHNSNISLSEFRSNDTTHSSCNSSSLTNIRVMASFNDRSIVTDIIANDPSNNISTGCSLDNSRNNANISGKNANIGDQTAHCVRKIMDQAPIVTRIVDRVLSKLQHDGSAHSPGDGREKDVEDSALLSSIERITRDLSVEESPPGLQTNCSSDAIQVSHNITVLSDANDSNSNIVKNKAKDQRASLRFFRKNSESGSVSSNTSSKHCAGLNISQSLNNSCTRDDVNSISGASDRDAAISKTSIKGNLIDEIDMDNLSDLEMDELENMVRGVEKNSEADQEKASRNDNSCNLTDTATNCLPDITQKDKETERDTDCSITKPLIEMAISKCDDNSKSGSSTDSNINNSIDTVEGTQSSTSRNEPTTMRNILKSYRKADDDKHDSNKYTVRDQDHFKKGANYNSVLHVDSHPASLNECGDLKAFRKKSKNVNQNLTLESTGNGVNDTKQQSVSKNTATVSHQMKSLEQCSKEYLKTFRIDQMNNKRTLEVDGCKKSVTGDILSDTDGTGEFSRENSVVEKNSFRESNKKNEKLSKDLELETFKEHTYYSKNLPSESEFNDEILNLNTIEKMQRVLTKSYRRIQRKNDLLRTSATTAPFSSQNHSRNLQVGNNNVYDHGWSDRGKNCLKSFRKSGRDNKNLSIPESQEKNFTPRHQQFDGSNNSSKLIVSNSRKSSSNLLKEFRKESIGNSKHLEARSLNDKVSSITKNKQPLLEENSEISLHNSTTANASHKEGVDLLSRHQSSVSQDLRSYMRQELPLSKISAGRLLAEVGAIQLGPLQGTHEYEDMNLVSTNLSFRNFCKC